MRIAFVTCTQYPNLTADDRLAADELRRRDATVDPVIWTDSKVDWSAFDVIILRSMWDYHLHTDEFNAWLDRIEHAGPPVWNPVATARWNVDKRYLRDLQNAGVPIVPTVWFERGEAPDVAAVLRENGWGEAVAKPVVSSTAFRTFRIPVQVAEALTPEVHTLLAERPAMLQEFQPEILNDGEWSLVYIDGALSHTVVKRAVAGDFRVQEEFGGTTHTATPPAEVVSAAGAALAAAPQPWLYGRVDGVLTPHGFRVGELELLEPGLFFMDDARAPARFTDAIMRVLNG
jgi:glutathione synthase/RimK-type ligase-like ATP-grasp enzyme